MTDYSGFSKLSVTGQIEFLQQAFLEIANNSAYNQADDKRLRVLLNSAKAVADSLKINGKTTGSRTYTVFCRWIAFLDYHNQYRNHVLFLQKFFRAYQSNKLRLKPVIDLRIYPYSMILKYQQTGSRITLQLQETVILMTDAQIRDLVNAILSHKKPAINQIIDSFVHEDKAKEMFNFFLDDLPSRTIAVKSNGSFFNLTDIFDRINRDYFSGKLEKPVLSWSAHPNRHRMGTYNFKTDTIMINKALDQRKTPDYVIDFVMYHEMLHKVLGYDTKGNRRRAHTTDFRKYEKSFPSYPEAEKYLNNLHVK